MDKIADYGIFEVHFNEKHTHIEEVHAYIITGYNSEGNEVTVGDCDTFKRDVIMGGMLFGKKNITLVKNNDKWEKGAEVITVPIDGEEFIKTKRNVIKEDNLDNLPEY